MNDTLGDRMKANYEDRFRISLPRRTNTIIRIDGKAFHTYTRNLARPYDFELMSDMDETARYLCQNIQGAKFAYVQSDEISILLTDYDDIKTEAWFDGNIQKMASISASLATAKFNNLRLQRACYQYDLEYPYKAIEDSQIADCTLALFDSRVFVIPDIVEVHNYFIWRQQDATRNSIQLAGQAQFSPKELNGRSCDNIQEKLFSEKGINWNDYPTGAKRGRAIVKRIEQVQSPINPSEMVYRSSWVIDSQIPIFTQNRDYLISHTQKVWLKENNENDLPV
jgi:tRNA(His) 5'-end guanylyltransferase